MKWFLFWCIILLVLAFIWAGYRTEDKQIKIEILERKLAGMEQENERLSREIVKMRLGGEWPHVRGER